MSTIRLHQTTTSTPEQYDAGLTDLGPCRSNLFGNSADEYLKGLGAFMRAAMELFGPEQARVAAEDWVDELGFVDMASYFGIVPRVSNSNETEHSGRIHKRGTKLGRTALVQSALIAARYSPYLKRFYEQVKARRGAGKAIIALARKFLGVIYRTLKNGWVFEDFPNFVLAEAS
jgi:hypothetical protein